MNSNPVAATPKEIAPQRASPPLPAIGAAFDQLLSIGLMSPTQAGKPDTAQPSERPKAKNDSDDAKAANAAAAVPAPAPQILAAITVATSSGEAKVATAAVPTPSAVKPPALAPDAAAGNADTNGAGAKLPPGAAEVEARVVAAAPAYLSQPNAALAGLWHHSGESPKAAPGQPGEPPTGSANAPSEATSATQAPTAMQAKDAASLAKDYSAQPHATPGIEMAQAAAADSGKASTAASGIADASNAVTVALPGVADAQLAAPQAPSADPALASPGQISPAWEQVAINLRQAAQGGSDRIEIQLKPASLGAIAVKLDLTHDGRITAVISADRSDTLNLLRQHSDGLAQALRDAGLRADTGSLSFNLRGDPQSFAQSSAPTVSAVRTDDPAAAPAARAEFTRLRHHAGAVDIEV